MLFIFGECTYTKVSITKLKRIAVFVLDNSTHGSVPIQAHHLEFMDTKFCILSGNFNTLTFMTIWTFDFLPQQPHNTIPSEVAPMNGHSGLTTNPLSVTLKLVCVIFS